MHKANIFILFCLSYLGGISFASFFIKDYFLWIILFLIIGIAIIGLFWKKEQFFYGLASICFAIGILLFGSSISKMSDLPIFYFAGKESVIIGKVIKNSEGFDRKKIVVDITAINSVNGSFGKILISNDKYNDVEFGDIVRVFGVLKKPENFSNFDYQGYLKKEDIAMLMNYPEIEVIDYEKRDLVVSFLNKGKNSISTSMVVDFVPAQAQVMQAMLLGESEKMSDDFKKQLSKSGISHAIAISGSHFVLIASFLFGLFLFLGFWKKQALVLTMVFIAIYIVMIFYPASSVRAGIMIGFVYLSKIVDRQAQEWRILILAGTVMCLCNPLILKYDLGFQLSFLAVSGLIFLFPLINNYLSKFWEKFVYLRELIASTFAAQIFVLPVIFSISQSFSIFSILANLLIIPIMPICLGLGFIYCFVFYIPFLSTLFVFILYPFIAFLLWVAESFSFLPELGFVFPSWMVIVFYAVLGFLIYKNRKRYPL